MRPSQPTAVQQTFWNDWNSSTRERELGIVSLDQADVICRWLAATGHNQLKIIEVGCGAGWLCKYLTQYGTVTATDLSNEVLERAALRQPDVNFIAGDFMELEFPHGSYDVVVSLEVLSHVGDQKAFIEKLTRLLRPGGVLMLGTQNRPALEKNKIPTPKLGQLRKWVDKNELRQLVEPHLVVEQLFSITPQFNRGPRRILNSHKMKRLLQRIGLQNVNRFIKQTQERAWQGWTLMILARKPLKEPLNN